MCTRFKYDTPRIKNPKKNTLLFVCFELLDCKKLYVLYCNVAATKKHLDTDNNNNKTKTTTNDQQHPAITHRLELTYS